MKIKIKKLNETAVKPSKAYEGDACFDLYVNSVNIDSVIGIVEYGSGIAIEIPENHVGLLFQRSSVSKTNLMMANCVGVVDSGYRGEVIGKFRVVGKEDEFKKSYKWGEKFAQLMIIPVLHTVLEVVEELSETVRGEGGFGSSGN